MGFGDDNYRYIDFLVPKECRVNSTEIGIDQKNCPIHVCNCFHNPWFSQRFINFKDNSYHNNLVSAYIIVALVKSQQFSSELIRFSSEQQKSSEKGQEYRWRWRRAWKPVSSGTHTPGCCGHPCQPLSCPAQFSVTLIAALPISKIWLPA